MKRTSFIAAALKPMLAGIISLALPAISLADITNVASATYSDSLSNVFPTAYSNAVVTTVSTPGNQAPVVSAIGVNVSDVDSAPGLQIYEGTTVTYTGTTRDTDSNTVTYQWLYTVNGGPEILMLNGANVGSAGSTIAVQPMVFPYPVGTAPKTYVWILRATDGNTSVQSTLTVNVIAQSVVTPVILPPVNLGELDGKTLTVNDEIGFTYPAIPGLTFEWTLTPKPGFQAPSSLLQKIKGAFSSGAPQATSAPKFNLSSLAPTPGNYVLSVSVLHSGSATQSGNASLTLVSANLNNVRVYPNPWRADRHGSAPITFTNLTVNTTIKIFTVAGHQIRSITTTGSSYDWDRKNDSGDDAASGLYVYLIKDDQGQKVRGKLAIVR